MNLELHSFKTQNKNKNHRAPWYGISLSVLAVSALLSSTTASAQVPDTLMAVRDSSNNTRMSLHKNGALLVGGTYDGGATSSGIPQEGAGTRLMWYPEKASFRAGYVDGTQWDDANIGIASFAVGEGVRASGDNSVALGLRCVAAQVSSFASGEQSTASGAASVAMGYHAHTNARQGSFVFADRSTPDTLRAGVNHSSNWRVSGGFRIFTSSNLTTGLTFQSGSVVSNWGQSNAVISTSTGAYLSTSGVWTNTSDVNRKHLFENISGEDILTKIRSLPITRWSYRTDKDNIRHIGPMAQDFYAAFKLGNDDKAIGTVDADGVALAGIKALEERTTRMAAELQTLKAENATLREKLDGGDRLAPLKTAGLPLLAIAGLGLGGILLNRRKKAQHTTDKN
jgi:hypothetical protein